MRAWKAAFCRMYPDAAIRLDDAGFEDIGEQPATSGPSLGKLQSVTLARFQKRFGFAPLEIAVCWYVQAVYVNKENPLVRGMQLREIKTIFSVLSWDAVWGDLDLKPPWAKRPIKLFVPRRAHARTLIGKRSNDRRFAFKLSATELAGRDTAVVRAISKHPDGLGLASLGSRTNNVRILPIATGGTSKFVLPTAENALNGSYPMAAKYFLTVIHNPRAGETLDSPRSEFLRYILSKNGQQAAATAGYTPLAARSAALALAKVGLVPSGADSDWDPVVIALRLREVPAETMRRFERVLARVRSLSYDKSLLMVAQELGRTGLRSEFAVKASNEPVTVRYRRVGVDQSDAQTAKRGRARVLVGLYHIWTERDGKATSSKTACFKVVLKHERIKISAE